jgi:hypothetical protein
VDGRALLDVGRSIRQCQIYRNRVIEAGACEDAEHTNRVQAHAHDDHREGTTVVAPAIGNAILATTGGRLRHLPIRPAAVLQALDRDFPGRDQSGADEKSR